ncbi:MAG: hypothetical protein STHCBS139747_006267 [Sporothrix thermara]
MSTTTTTSTQHTSSFAPSTFSAPQRKTMSITQTYFLAHKARAKLSSQAARPDHNLRLLVGHANLLDTLMLELADAEREQESWFNQSVRGASENNKAAAAAPSQKADRHVQWADAVIEEPEEDWEADDDSDDASSEVSSDYSDSDEEEDEEDEVYNEESPVSSLDDDDVEEDLLMADAAPLRRVSSHKAAAMLPADEADEDYEEVEDDEASHAHLTLTRSPSHSSVLSSPSSSTSSSATHISSISSPPELVIEEDSDISSEDDESMPPSPPAVTLQSFDQKAAAAATTTTTTIRAIPSSQQQDDDDDEHDAFEHDSTAHYYLPPRNPARGMTALSVY